MITTPTYQPEVRLPKGFQPLTRSAMSIICDACGKARTRKGGHDKCSKARQAEGFIIKQETRG